MNVRERVRMAWPTTFGIHVFQMMLAGTFAVPIVASVPMPDVLVRAPVAAWISAMRLGGSLGEDTLRNAVLPLMAAALNYPWLSVAWLRALDQPEPFMAHARYALGRYRVAVTIAILIVLGVAALSVGAVLTARSLHSALAGEANERASGLASLAAVVPFAVFALVLVTYQDAAYAVVSRGESSVRATLRAALAALSGKLVLLRAAFMLGMGVLAGAAWLLPRATFGPGAAADLGVLLLTQVAALAMTSLRAVWLARVCERVS